MRALNKIWDPADMFQGVADSAALAPIAAEELLCLAQEIAEAHVKFTDALAHQNKDYIRGIHLEAKKNNAGFDPEIIRKKFQCRIKYFKSAKSIDPSRIQPKLYLCDGALWNDLFAITRACWSMPYNKGYGRRLRFVVFDEYHEAVIGIIGLQSPPADLKSRDDLFSYPKGRKLELVNNTLDAYTVGSIPPYSFLLGGKLCAGLISTETIRRMYWRKYATQKSLMLDTTIHQPLVAVTTTSAFGRSSIYNRLKLKDRLLAEPIGYTKGFGTVHLEHLYDRITNVLKANGTFTPAGFGNGPKVRWQNITKGLMSLGTSPKLLQHGLKREVFLFRFVEDLESGMSGREFGNTLTLEEEDFSNYWKQRWALPRAARYEKWNEGDSLQLIQDTLNNL